MDHFQDLDATDVFIKKKRNKEGKVFDFARFVGIKYVHSLEYQLKNVWFCSYKIWANV